jgi:GxxExxY protein
MYLHAELTGAIIGAAIEVHRELGPGLLESVYQKCLAKELTDRGFAVRTGVKLPVVYKGAELDCDFFMDMVVDEVVVLELKSVEQLLAVHEAQLLTYMRLSGIQVGLLINFNVPVLKEGIVRRVL